MRAIWRTATRDDLVAELERQRREIEWLRRERAEQDRERADVERELDRRVDISIEGDAGGVTSLVTPVEKIDT